MRGQRIQYSPEELEFIQANCTLPRAERYQVYQGKFHRPEVSQANLDALCKRKRWLTGRTGQFKKGNIPHPNARPRGPNATSFKKGQVPPNRKPLWSERICTKDGYILMKIPERDPHTGFPTRYKHKHVWIWEQEHGPVPDGMVVSFIDGDKMNCSLDNLELLHRGDLAVFNKLGGNTLPGEIRTAAKLIAKVSTKSRQRKEPQP